MLTAEADTAAYSGQMREARRFYQLALEDAERGKFEGVADEMVANEAVCEAFVGDAPQARELAAAAIARKRTDPVLYAAAFAMAMANDPMRAAPLADELAKQVPSDTIVNEIFVPTIRSQIEIDHSNAGKAVDVLQRAQPYELGFVARLVPIYVRGEAYLRLGRSQEAAAEFQRILDHRGSSRLSMIDALAHLGLARAYALSGDGAKSRTAYQDFFALWKDAEPDIPIVKQANAEYATVAERVLPRRLLLTCLPIVAEIR